MRLNHPKPSPYPQSMEKFSSLKPVPGAKKVWDHCSIETVCGPQSLKCLLSYLL